jgi:hypothetical protein
MKTRLASCGAIAAALLCLPSLLFAQIQGERGAARAIAEEILRMV